MQRAKETHLRLHHVCLELCCDDFLKSIECCLRNGKQYVSFDAFMLKEKRRKRGEDRKERKEERKGGREVKGEKQQGKGRRKGGREKIRQKGLGKDRRSLGRLHESLHVQPCTQAPAD